MTGAGVATPEFLFRSPGSALLPLSLHFSVSVPTPHSPCSLQMPPFCRRSYETTFTEIRAALPPLTSRLHSFPSSQPSKHREILRYPARCKLRAKIPPARLCEQLRAVSRSGEQEGTSSRPRRGTGGQQSPLRGSGGARPAPPPSPLHEGTAERPHTRPPPGSPRRVTHRRERAPGSSSAPALTRPGRRRGRGAPWAAAAGPHRTRRRQPHFSGGRGGRGRPGRTRSAGSGGPTACVLKLRPGEVPSGR